MKRLTVLMILAMALCLVTSAWASSLSWTASTGATGYVILYKNLAATTWTEVDVLNVTTWTLPASLTAGTRYCFKARAYVGPVATRSFRGDSDEIRYTVPGPTVVVELPESPKSMLFYFWAIKDLT
jgi:hypothetical protein